MADFLAVLAGLTTVLVALGGVVVQLRRLEIRVDGRLTELLELTRKASLAEGKQLQLEQTSTGPAERLTGHNG